MAGFRGIMTSVAVTMLFVLSLLMFATLFIAANNPTTTVLTNSSVAKYTAKLEATITNFTDDTNAQLQSVRPGGTGLIAYVTSIFLIIPAALNIPLGLFHLIIDGISAIGGIISATLGFSGGASALNFVMGLITSLIFIAAMFLFIKFIRGGESER